MKKQLAVNMNVAIYCRLSRDDENVGESESIQNQRAMLTDYANSQGFTIYSEYCDDGYSGLNFERPNFKRMMTDIDNGHVICNKCLLGEWLTEEPYALIGHVRFCEGLLRLEPLIAEKSKMKGSEKSRQSLLDGNMDYQGYGTKIMQTINHIPYGVAIFPEYIAKTLAEQFAIPLEQAQKVTNVNLKRLADKEQIERLQKGIYYKAKETVFGKTKPNIDNVMTQVLTMNEEEIIGYETGASFLNQIGLTTLMPREKEIATNGYRRKLDANCHIVMKKPVMEINTNNYKYLQVLDVVQGLQNSYVDADSPYMILSEYIEKQSLDKFELVCFARKYYGQKTLLKLLDIIMEVGYETS